MIRLLLLFTAAILLSACRPAGEPQPQAPPSEFPTIQPLLPTPSPSPTRTTSPTPLPEPTFTPIPTASPTPLPQPEIYSTPGQYFETVLSIPVGRDGILYRGAGVEDMEIVGPNGLVVSPDGAYIVGDVNGNRLLRYDASGKRLDDIDLTPLEILNISDMVGSGDLIYILEISFKVLPERYRLNVLTITGELVRQYDLPKGFHFEDGLFGLALSYPSQGDPEAVIEMIEAGESRYYREPQSPADLPAALPALQVFGRDLQVQGAGQGEQAALQIAGSRFSSRMTAGGRVIMLAARPDGSLFLQREDVVAWEPAITTDITVHFITPDGLPAGAARYPIMDWYFHIWRFLTVGPDGNVYALITREKSVDVLRLNFYQELPPLRPEAASPEIVTHSPEAAPGCSNIQRLPVDSPEARQIIDQFIASFRQDWPTEYMGFVQVWSVDQLEDYAVIQGLVTDEESDIIVVKQNEHGYFLAARLTSHSQLPAKNYTGIQEFLAAQAPQAPPELLACLDTARFLEAIK